ncbi:hypothetical protein FPV67DRAFT_334474 [Lyophyllum atratum]|nr:hypothetical protein FPV67DRAFT_334474 [Lyophyllum atratum]
MVLIHPVRIALYTALAIFSIVLMGLTAARIAHTKSLGLGYNPIIAELLSVSILSFLWSLPIMWCIGRRFEGGYASSYLTELLGLFVLWVMYLVGAAIHATLFHNANVCWGISPQCRIMTAIQAFAWINWIIISFLILAALANLIFGRAGGLTAPLHGRHGAETAAAAGGAAGYGAGHQAQERQGVTGGAGNEGYQTGPGTGGQQGAPETRSVEGGGPVSGGHGGPGAPAMSSAV